MTIMAYLGANARVVNGRVTFEAETCCTRTMTSA
jgi:hypothetical protein